MGSIISAIAEDIETYLYLCEKYGEKPELKTDHWGNTGPNPYGEHGKKLRKRIMEES